MMKLSNKLLTGFAVALILIPLLGMIYVSQVNYKKGTREDIAVATDLQDHHFNTPSRGMTEKSLGAFTTVKVEVSGKWHLNVLLIKDQQSGVKIQNGMDNFTTLRIDEKGCLHIGLKGNEKNWYRQIVIYSPVLQALEVNKAESAALFARLDSLHLTVRHTDRVSLMANTTINHLTLHADEVKDVSVNEVSIKDLQLNLGGASFYSENSFDELAVQASGKAELHIGEDRGNPGTQVIKHLDIHTSDSVTVKIGGAKIEKCSGSFSDGTKILAMPALNLNQMYRK